MFFFASDLHLGANAKGDAAVARLAERLERESGPKDVLLLAGDLATNDDQLIRCLQMFRRRFRGTCAGILGNHDIWVGPDGDSLERYRFGQTLLEREGFQALEEHAMLHDGWGLVGAMAWYDGSFADASLNIPIQNYLEKREPWKNRVIWADATRVRWNMNDPQATAWQHERMQKRLEEVSGAERVIALLHHLPHKRLLVHPRWLVPKRWRFANAFLGSSLFGNLLETDGRVRLAVNGHIHLARSHRSGSLRYESIGGSYTDKQLVTFDGAQVRRVTVSA